MKPAYVAAAVLLLGAAYVAAQASNAAAPTDNPDDAGLLGALGDTYDETTATLFNIINPTPASDMQVSQQQIAVLKQREGLRLSRYYLGDGTATIGYGHSGTTAQIPATCTQAQADAWFASDVEQRAARWVRLYVTVPLTQYQFDSLVDVAYNMSPRSFKKFADSVNAGQGIDGIAQASVAWVAPSLQNGIQNRRDAEVDQFNNGVYA